MMEVELNRDTIRFIIDKAHELQIEDDVNFDNEPKVSNEDWSRQMTSDYGRDPYYQELKTTIEDLEPDQQMSLVALMWVGRGDFAPEEWSDALREAEQSWTSHTADYLIGTAMLADYLAESLEQLESAQEEQ